MNKKILFYICSATLLLGSCTKDFNSVNTDPTQSTAAQEDPNLLLSSTEIEYFNGTTGASGALLMQSMWAQILASAQYPSYYSNGDKYVASGNLTTYQGSLWLHCYNSASYAYECLALAAGKAGLVNLRAAATIMELFDFQTITDTYGDCPYTQAVQGKSSVYLPVYDAQSSIYPSLLSRLDSAISTFDASQAIPTHDLFYKGNISKWKKFGYSMMLRMAMRLTKVDPTTAQKYAEKAYAGGTFAGTADDAFITFDHADGYNNNNSSQWQTAEDFSEVHWGQSLIAWLKANNDPRVSVIAEVADTGATNAANESLMGDTTYTKQLGMPNGYDENGLATDISKAPGWPGGTGTGGNYDPTGKYSRPAIGEYVNYNLPAFAINYAETELLLAEAAVRGWNVGVSASQHYANALAAALTDYGTLSSYGALPAATITAYVTAHPLDISSSTNSINQINMQYWATTGTLWDFNEAWSNWRRSGIPALTPVKYTGNFTGGTVPRRQAYPVTEPATNGANYQAAVSKLSGGDLFSGRVWWDK